MGWVRATEGIEAVRVRLGESSWGKPFLSSGESGFSTLRFEVERLDRRSVEKGCIRIGLKGIRPESGTLCFTGRRVVWDYGLGRVDGEATLGRGVGCEARGS